MIDIQKLDAQTLHVLWAAFAAMVKDIHSPQDNLSKKHQAHAKLLWDQLNLEKNKRAALPYLEETKVVIEYTYNPEYGDNRICACGHPYYRHFDTYEQMAIAGCKYCGCHTFEEGDPKEVKIVKIAQDHGMNYEQNENGFWIIWGKSGDAFKGQSFETFIDMARAYCAHFKLIL